MSRSRIPKHLRDGITTQFKSRCAYCQTQQKISGISLTVDHIVPESLGGVTTLQNLCLACWDCNLAKGNRIALFDDTTKEQVRLFHPQRQSWSEHFTWSTDASLILGKTATGRVTVIALQMNRVSLVISRRLWQQVGWHPPSD